MFREEDSCKKGMAASASEKFRTVCEGEFDPSEIIVRGDGYVELRSPDKLWGCLPGCNLDTDTPWSNFAASLAKYPDKVCLLLSLLSSTAD